MLVGIRLLITALFFIGGGALLTEHWEDHLKSIGVERHYFGRKIEEHESDYLAAMRDTYLGYKTVLYRDPEVLFFGDSHTYSSWDFQALQEGLPCKAGCYSISGAFLENVCDLLDAIKAQGLSTRYLVIGLSPRMLFDSSDKQTYLQQFRRELATLGVPQENFVTLAKGEWRKVDRFVGGEGKVRETLPPLEAGLERVDPRDLRRFIDKNVSEFKMFHYWLQCVEEGRPCPELPAVIEQIGRKAKECGVQIAVVYIPESRWLTELYTPDQRAHFHATCRELEKIAGLLDVEWYTRGGGDDRFFVNRFMLADYPYDVWKKDGQAAKQWIDVDAPNREWQLFDADHMNLAGAKEFTRSVTPSIRTWIEQADAARGPLRR